MFRMDYLKQVTEQPRKRHSRGKLPRLCLFLFNQLISRRCQACRSRTSGFSSTGCRYPHNRWGRVGKRRLTISLWQVCADPSQNRACTSQCTRLAVVLLDYIFLKSMMNLLVAIVTYHHCFSAFCNHNYFPRFFSFQIFHLVHMMHFVFSVFSLITT